MSAAAVGWVAGVGAILVATALALARYGRRRQADDLIDGLISSNQFRPQPGMEHTDWTKVNRAGAARWRQVAQAQNNVAAQASGGLRGRLMRYDTARAARQSGSDR